jgi:hypothetical protein
MCVFLFSTGKNKIFESHIYIQIGLPLAQAGPQVNIIFIYLTLYSHFFPESSSFSLCWDF